LWDKFFNIFAAPSDKDFHLDGEKYKHDSIIFSICGTIFQKFMQRLQLEVSIQNFVQRLRLEVSV
jgi:hypothetical protein